MRLASESPSETDPNAVGSLGRAVASISRDLISGAADLDEVLGVAGRAMRVSRAYLFRLSEGGDRMRNTHEWCAPGTTPQREALQDLPASIFPWWMARLHADELIVVPDVDALPDEAAAERDTLREQDVRALVVAPIRLGTGRLEGFVGFDDCEDVRAWREDDVFTIRLLGDLLAGYLATAAREAFQTAVEASNRAGIAVVDAEGRQRYVNPAFCEMVGWPEDKLVGAMPPFVYWPDRELPAIQEAFAQALRGGTPPGGFALQFQRRDGELFDAQVLLSRLDPIGPDDAGGWLASVFDVTEWRQAERALRASRERIDFVLDAAQVGTWDWDLTTNTVEWSRNLVAIHGRSPGDFHGTFESVQEDILPEDKALLHEAIDRALTTREDYRVQYRVLAADGRILWVEAKGRARYDDDGRPVRMAGICMDVTARAEAEAALRQERHVLETVNRINTSLAAELDQEKLVQAVTDAGTELSGAQFGAFFYNVLDEQGGAYMLYALSGAPRSAFERFPMPRATRIVHPTFEGEGIIRLDDVTKDARYGRNPPYDGMPEGHLPVRSYLAVPVIARDGAVLGGLFFGHGEAGVFTEEAEEIVRGIADQAAIAIENARLFAGAQRELRERQRAERHLTELNERLEAHVAARTEDLAAANTRLRAEVRERARAEAALAQTNRALVQRNRELQDFAYVASHDLQEPLRKISSFADLLSHDYGDALGEQGRQFLGRMQESALRMSTLLRDLLAFSRVSTHADPVAPHDLGEIVTEVLADLELQLRDAGGAVEVGPLPHLEVDRTQMRQLFQNLIGNALKFHRPDAPPTVRVHAEEDGGAWRIEVSDDGIGFEEKYLDRIFKPFQRLHGRDEYPGTGMGLAICRRIVERHEGTLTARSAPGEGATFMIRLPAGRREG